MKYNENDDPTTPTTTSEAGSPTLRGRLVPILLALALFLTLAPTTEAGHDLTEGQQDLRIAPLEGPPGTTVWIEGGNLSEDLQVYFGDQEVPPTRDADGRVGFVAPEGALEAYEVRVLDQDRELGFCCFRLTEAVPETQAGTTGDAEQAPAAPAPCQVPGINMQCNVFGTIQMDGQRHIRGDPISLTTTVTLDTDLADQGARYVLFSVRHVTEASGAESPVLLRLDRFGTDATAIEPMRSDIVWPNEINLWVNVLDLPVDTPIRIDLTIGATEAGAHTVETLVMPFDRGYAPIHDASWNEISLYAYTLLGVSEPTGADLEPAGKPLLRGFVPALGAPVALGVLGIALFLARRRSA